MKCIAKPCNGNLRKLKDGKYRCESCKRKFEMVAGKLKQVAV